MRLTPPPQKKKVKILNPAGLEARRPPRTLAQQVLLTRRHLKCSFAFLLAARLRCHRWSGGNGSSATAENQNQEERGVPPQAQTTSLRLSRWVLFCSSFQRPIARPYQRVFVKTCILLDTLAVFARRAKTQGLKLAPVVAVAASVLSLEPHGGT